MLTFFFIKKYKKDVQAYISSVYVAPPRPKSIPRYSISVTPASQEPNIDASEIKYSDRDPDIRYSLRMPDEDKFDAEAVSESMKSYLADKTPAKPLSQSTNSTFVDKLLWHIRSKNLIEPEVYKAAQVDRRLFSKIISNKDYTPSKDTVLAFIFALRLSLKEANDLLERAGYSLSHSLRRDIILEYFIKEGIYNLNNINAFLYNMSEKIIGRNI